jgi:hypothetical protein
MLLAHAMHYKLPLSPEFDSLTHSLMEISRRWNGPHAQPGSENLASKFAARLVQARDQGPNSLDLRESAFSGEQNREDVPEHNGLGMNMNGHPMQNGFDIGNTMGMEQAGEGSPDSISLAFPPLPLAFQGHSQSAIQTAMPSPVPNHLQPPGFQGYDQSQYEMGMNGGAMNGGPMGSGGLNGFEDLNSFFEYSFLPTQRISMFSGGREEDVD